MEEGGGDYGTTQLTIVLVVMTIKLRYFVPSNCEC